MTNTPMTDNSYKVENMQAHDDIVDNLYEQLNYLETLPDFNESCTTLYIVEAIMTIRKLRTSEQQNQAVIAELRQQLASIVVTDNTAVIAQQAQTIAELVEALDFMERHSTLHSIHPERVSARTLIIKVKGK